MKIDWKRKLTSRKFWAMLAGVVIGIVVYARSAEKSQEALAGIITSAGALIAYMIGEGIADHGSGAEAHPAADQGQICENCKIEFEEGDTNGVSCA